MDKAKLKRAVKQTKKKWEGILEELGDGMDEDEFHHLANDMDSCGFCRENSGHCSSCVFKNQCDTACNRAGQAGERKDWRANAKRICKYVIREAEKMLERTS